MINIANFPGDSDIRFVLMDIDDTLTTDGRLPAAAYAALESLHEAGFKVAPITGRPAGWCDMIARFWPVDAVVGENGAMYFRYDTVNKKMVRRYWKTAGERLVDRRELDRLAKEIPAEVPGCAVASDQAYREADLAIDFCEDVPPLKDEDVNRIVQLFEQAGANAKISSIHVNGWFGNYDKLAMTKKMIVEVFGADIETVKDKIVFAGDSPNDCPMFGYFPNSVGVANVLEFEGKLEAEPAWVTKSRGGLGFAELAEILLKSKSR